MELLITNITTIIQILVISSKKNLLDAYTNTEPPQVLYYRTKDS
jgi:hypothetical protein